MAVIMGLSSGASATTFHPPWTGTVDKVVETASFGCFAMKNPVKPAFSKLTGIAVYSAATSAKGCKAPSGYVLNSLAELEGGDLLMAKLKVPAGATMVTVTSAEKFTETATVLPVAGVACPQTPVHYVDPSNGSYDYNGSLGSCYMYAETQIQAEAFLYDSTNHTYIYPDSLNVNNFTFIENYTDAGYVCYGPGWATYGIVGCVSNNRSGTLSEVQSGTAFSVGALSTATQAEATNSTAYVNYTYVGTHTYWLVWQVLGFDYSWVSSEPGAKATALVDYGSAGSGISLKAVTVT